MSTERARFGLSSYLFHAERLALRHFEAMRDHGFEYTEIFATRTHFDYHDVHAVDAVGQWLSTTGVRAGSLHAPIASGFANGIWGHGYSTAALDAAKREEAFAEIDRAIAAAARLGCHTVVVHPGVPSEHAVPGDNDAASFARTIERLAALATAREVALAIEVIPNTIAGPRDIFELLSGDLSLGATGACVDFGHAHLGSGASDAVETLAGYILTTHVHDNRGTADDHLLPFAGTIDWTETLTTLTKVGYTGPFVLELPDHGDAMTTLQRAVGARRRLQGILDSLAEPWGFAED